MLIHVTMADNLMPFPRRDVPRIGPVIASEDPESAEEIKALRHFENAGSFLH